MIAFWGKLVYNRRSLLIAGSFMSEGYKKCPYCNRVIMGNATECKHCGASLGGGGEEVNTANSSDNATYSYGNSDISFVEGLTFMFTDKAFITKFLGLFIVILIMALVYMSFLPNMVINSNSANPAEMLKYAKNMMSFNLMILIVCSLMFGYQISCIKRISTQSGAYNLPAIKFLSNLGTGIKFYIAMFIFILPFSILMGILMFILAFLGPLSMLASFALWIIIMTIIPAFMWIFAQRRYWTVFYRFDLLRKVLDGEYARYGKALLFMFLYGLICWIIIGIGFFMFGKMLLSANLLLLAIIYSLALAYSTYVAAYVMAKSINPDKIRYLP